MKKKILAGALVFLLFIVIVTAVIIKEGEHKKEVDKIFGNTIRNALESDSGMSMDDISDTFSKGALEAADYENLADIVYAKSDGESICLVFVDCEIENAFYLSTRLIDESGDKTLLITWGGTEYEVNKEKSTSNEELANMFPGEWETLVNQAFSGNGIKISAGDAERIDEAVKTFIGNY